MSKLYLFLISLTIVLVLCTTLLAEPANSGLEIGAQVGIARGFTESDAEGFGPDLFMFVQTPLLYKFRANIGAGWGHIQDGDYKTCMLPIKAQLMFYPAVNEMWNSYLYVGGGYLPYVINDLPDVFDYYVDTDASTGFVSFGLGATYKISDTWSYDFSGGYNQTFTDSLEGYAKDSDDGYIELLAGIKYRFKFESNDFDGDGIQNDDEDVLGTDPNNPDSDGDGLKDGEEVNTFKTDPLNEDSDSDGLTDGQECKQYRSNPLSNDSDRDGLQDGDEVKNYLTNPIKADSDGDGLEDFIEINTYKTSPIDKDTDGDILNDGEELLKYNTNPMSGDTDGDGITDFDEIEKYGTNPRDADTDHDKLGDWEEISKYKTDPFSTDTDSGSVDDYTEVDRGTNPLNRDDDVIKEVFESTVDAKIVLDGIVFNSGSAEILPESEEILEKAYRTLNSFTKIVVEIRGYTDNTGSLKINMELSQKRAESIRTWLIDKGIRDDRLIAKGFGPENPIAPNDTPDGRRQNRRIEFIRVR